MIEFDRMGQIKNLFRILNGNVRKKLMFSIFCSFFNNFFFYLGPKVKKSVRKKERLAFLQNMNRNSLEWNEFLSFSFGSILKSNTLQGHFLKSFDVSRLVFITCI